LSHFLELFWAVRPSEGREWSNSSQKAELTPPSDRRFRRSPLPTVKNEPDDHVRDDRIGANKAQGEKE
jgi:hypothetical protein